MKRSWLYEALGNDTMAINRTDLSYTGRTINNVVTYALCILLNISFVVLFKPGGSKTNDIFDQKGIVSVKTCQNCTFKVNFLRKKTKDLKKESLMNIS